MVQARKFWCMDSNKELLQNTDGMCSICENWLKTPLPRPTKTEGPCRELRILLPKACTRAEILDDVTCHYTHLPAASLTGVTTEGYKSYQTPAHGFFSLLRCQHKGAQRKLLVRFQVGTPTRLENGRVWYSDKELIYTLSKPWVSVCLWFNLKETN